MNAQEVVDSVLDIDNMLAEAESALEAHKYNLVESKIREARDVITDLKEDDCCDDASEVEMNIVNLLK